MKAYIRDAIQCWNGQCLREDSMFGVEFKKITVKPVKQKVKEINSIEEIKQ